MKEKLIRIAYVVAVFVVIALVFLYLSKRQESFKEIEVAYIGVENGGFKYDINDEGTDLFCQLTGDWGNIKKDDVVTLVCQDEYFSFLTFKRDIKLTNILTTALESKHLKGVIASEFEGDVYYKVDGALDVVTINEDGGTYRLEVYDDLYYDGERLVRYDVVNDGYYYTDKKVIVEESGLNSAQVRERVNSYLANGYQQLVQ